MFGSKNLGAIWGTVDGITVGFGVFGPIFLGWTFDNFGTYVPALYVLSLILFTAIPTLIAVFGNPKNSSANSG